VGWQEPIGCGGVAVHPNDLVIVDSDGAVCLAFSRGLGLSLIVLRPCSVYFSSVMYVAM
jgi:hypothetical protein